MARLLGHVADIRRFDNAEAHVTSLGVTPKQRTSGSSAHGQAVVKRLAMFAAASTLYGEHDAASPHPVLNRFTERLRATDDNNRAGTSAHA